MNSLAVRLCCSAGELLEAEISLVKQVLVPYLKQQLKVKLNHSGGLALFVWRVTVERL